MLNESLEDGLADLIQTKLKIVDVFMQAGGEDFLDGGVGQIRAETAHMAQRQGHAFEAGICAERFQGGFHFRDAAGDGAREGFIKQEIGDDSGGIEAAVMSLEGMPGGAGAQQGGPAQGAGLRVRGELKRKAGAGVQQAGHLVRTLEAGAEAEEVPDFTAGSGGISNALELIGAAQHTLVESGALHPVHVLAFGGIDEEPERIERLPDFVGDLIAHGACVFTRGADAVEHRVGVVGTEGEEFGDVLAFDFFMQFGISLFIAGGGEEGLPELRFIDAFGSGIEQEVLGGKQEA